MYGPRSPLLWIRLGPLGLLYCLLTIQTAIGAEPTATEVAEPPSREVPSTLVEADGVLASSPMDNPVLDAAVLTIHQDRYGLIWIGSTRGLQRFDGLHARSFTFDDQGADAKRVPVYAIYEDTAGIFWLATDSGLFRFDPATEAQRHLPPPGGSTVLTARIADLFAGTEEDIWLATAGGLLRFDPSNETYKPLAMDGTTIAYTAAQRDPLARDIAWLTTADGVLHRFNLAQQSIEAYPLPTAGFAPPAASAIAIDGSGQVWLGTAGALHRFDPAAQRFVRFALAPWATDGISAMVTEPGKDALWLVARPGGLIHYESVAGRATRWVQADQLRTLAWDRTGGLWVGSLDSGVQRYAPRRFGAVAEAPPPILITGLHINHQPVAFGGAAPLARQPFLSETLTLGPDDRRITFELALLDFANPRANTFAYRLEGFSEAWTRPDAASRATFTNLEPGRYVFRARGITSRGQLSGQDAVLALHVRAPLWATWWFRAACLLALLAAAFFANTKRVRTLRQANDAAEASAERWHKLFVESNEGLFELDADGRIVTVNPAGRRLMGLGSEDDAATLVPADLFAEGGHGWLDLLAELERQQAVREVPLRLRTKSGEMRDVLVNAQLADPERSLAGGLRVYMRDITLQMKLEAQVLHAQKLEAIGALAGGIAHDFNNILGAIQGFSTLAQIDLESLTNPEAVSASEKIEYALTAVHRATELTKQILAFSRRTDAGERPVDPEPVIKEAMKLLHSTLPASVRIDQRLDSQKERVVIDPTKLHQVVMNLCTNAYHAMPDGGVLTITLVPTSLHAPLAVGPRQLAPGRYLKLMVADTGCGMGSNTRVHMFEPFFTTKETNAGTGLGLAVVLGIIEDCGGGITVESTPETGTTFEIFIPALPPSVEGEEEGEEPWHLQRGDENLLLVDDDDDLRDSTCAQLRYLGYTVEVAANAEQALTLFDQAHPPFAAVITGMTMSGMSGIELAQIISRRNQAVPVILMTGFSEVLDQEAALRSGAVEDFLIKPVDLSRLSNALRRALETTPSTGSFAVESVNAD